MEVEVGAVFILIEGKSSALFAVLFNGEEILLLLSDIEKHVHTYIYHVWSIVFIYAKSLGSNIIYCMYILSPVSAIVVCRGRRADRGRWFHRQGRNKFCSRVRVTREVATTSDGHSIAYCIATSRTCVVQHNGCQPNHGHGRRDVRSSWAVVIHTIARQGSTFLRPILTHLTEYCSDGRPGRWWRRIPHIRAMGTVKNSQK